MSRRRSKALTIGSRRARKRSRFAALLPPSGLVRKSKAPSSYARTVISPPFTVRALSMITPALMPAAAIASSTSMPFISGMRAHLRSHEGLGVLLRQVQARALQGHRLRQVRRRGGPVQGAARAHGPHRAGRSGQPHLVLQGHAQPLRLLLDISPRKLEAHPCTSPSTSSRRWTNMLEPEKCSG